MLVVVRFVSIDAHDILGDRELPPDPTDADPHTFEAGVLISDRVGDLSITVWKTIAEEVYHPLFGRCVHLDLL